MRMLRLVVGVLAAAMAAVFFAVRPAMGQAGGGGEERVTAEVVWQKAGLAAGESVGLAVVMTVHPGWHINPGAESGQAAEFQIPTTIAVMLPAGWTAGAAMWPGAQELDLPALGGRFAVHEGRVVAFVKVMVGGDAEPGRHEAAVRVGYQACDESVCEMPTSVSATGSIEILAAGVSAGAVSAETAKLFEGYRGGGEARTTTEPAGGIRDGQGEAEQKRAAQARPLNRLLAQWNWWVTLAFVWAAMGWMAARTFAITKKWGWRATVAVVAVAVSAGWYGVTTWLTAESPVHWIEYSEERLDRLRAEGERVIVVEFTAEWCINCKVLEKTVLSQAEVAAVLNSDRVIAMKADVTASDHPGWKRINELGGGGIPLTLVYQPGKVEPIALRSVYTRAALLNAIEGGEGGSVAGANGKYAFDFLGLRFDVSGGAWPVVLILAGLAGFFMNFTPCVLPVIPIKILSLQAHASKPARCLALGAVFGAGIVAAYAALGVLIAGLIGSAYQLDWGEMFSRWWFSGLMGLLVAVMGLGMMGLFAIRLPQFVYLFNPQSDSMGGSFFMGMFTAVLATPCTGPLVGATIVWVAAQPAWLALVTFVVMGMGMAFPYVLLTARPAWLARLPRTGPGSELVKQVMGLLLMAVAVFFIGAAVNGWRAGGAEQAGPQTESAMIEFAGRGAMVTV